MRVVTYTVPAPKNPEKATRKRTNFKSISIREIDGNDEVAASKMAEAKGQPKEVLTELICMSIVKVDGKPVAQPFGDWNKWNGRSRKFALDAYIDLNGTEEEDRVGFLESATVEDLDSPAALPQPAVADED